MMPTPSEDAVLRQVDAQRQWFWAKFSAELGAVKRLYSSDTDLNRLEVLRRLVLWLHNAIWMIHRVRLQSKPPSGRPQHDELNVVATDLLFWQRKFEKTFQQEDFDRVVRDYERIPSLGGLMRASYSMLCKDLALHHIRLLKEHRKTLIIRLPNWDKLATPNTFEVRAELALGLPEGLCFYNDGGRPDVSPADVVAVNAEFDKEPDFNFAAQVEAGTTEWPAIIVPSTTPPATGAVDTGYLGLFIDARVQEVTRPDVTHIPLKVSATELKLVDAMTKAGSVGITSDAAANLHAGSADALHQFKAELKSKLAVLKITMPRGKWKLIEERIPK